MSMEFKDYYKTLGVDRAADARTISRAYRRLARQHHPDVNKAAGAEDRFKEINEAYQVLGNAEKRARYDQMYEAYQRGGLNWDQLLRGAPTAQAPGGFTVTYGDPADLEDLLGGVGGFSDFFRQFFGGDVIGQASRRRRGEGVPSDMGRADRPRAEASLELTLEEAFRGAHKAVTVQVKGATRRLEVTIPRGARSGQRLRLAGALDGADLYLTLQVRPHPVFERQGDDVALEVPVTLPEAMLGTEVQVPTLEGPVSMKVAPESQNGRVYRLRGLGFPRADGTRADQLARIKVVLPTRLTEEERRFFEAMRARRRENPRQAGKTG